VLLRIEAHVNPLIVELVDDLVERKPELNDLPEELLITVFEILYVSGMAGKVLTFRRSADVFIYTWTTVSTVHVNRLPQRVTERLEYIPAQRLEIGNDLVRGLELLGKSFSYGGLAHQHFMQGEIG
jgi:hypothetical protein